MKSYKAWLIIFTLLFISVIPADAVSLPDSAVKPRNDLYKVWSSQIPESPHLTFNKVQSQVLAAIQEDGSADVLVVLGQKADLSRVVALANRGTEGQVVAETLQNLAQCAQAPLRAWLEARAIPYRAFYIVNAIQVEVNRDILLALASRPEVTRIVANPRVAMQPPMLPVQPERVPLAASSIEWGVSKIGAPQVWSLGYTGRGVVVAGQDTGYDWDHPALKAQYRGWDGVTVNHDYAWHDAIHSGGSVCGADSPEPCDDNSHGTHTMGTIVGDDGDTHQIGVAPGAQWIGCRNMDRGYGTPATYIECFEFFLAPYPVGETPDGGHADPAMAPDVINNSWSCPTSEGCDWQTLQDVAEVMRAAGIMVVSSAGNGGSSCSTVREPISLYDAVYTVGATDGADAIVSFSSRGPVTIDGSGRLKPDLVAPGVGVLSSLPGGGYGAKSGTSMAAPHVTGAFALLWSARPDLRRHITVTETLLNGTAVSRYSTQCGDVADAVPNNVYGWGRLDVWTAVQAAVTPTGVLSGTVRTPQGLPLSGAEVRATLTSTATWQTVSGAGGGYEMRPLSGTYTVTASLSGYESVVHSGIRITAQQTTTLPITLCMTCTSLVDVDFDVVPPEPVAQMPVTFTGTAPIGTPPLTYTWNFGYEGAGLFGNPVTHTFPEAESSIVPYRVTMTATNACSQQVKQDWITVRSAASECFSIDGLAFTFIPQEPFVGNVVTFTGTVLKGMLPITYTWNFGDDTLQDEGNPVGHTFPPSTGIMPYRVTVTATNMCSNQTRTGQVTVRSHLVYLPLIIRQSTSTSIK